MPRLRPFSRSLTHIAGLVDQKIRHMVLGSQPRIQELAEFYELPFRWAALDLCGDKVSLIDYVTFTDQQDRNLHVVNLYRWTKYGDEDISIWNRPQGPLCGYLYWFDEAVDEAVQVTTMQEIREVLREFNPPTANGAVNDPHGDLNRGIIRLSDPAPKAWERA